LLLVAVVEHHAMEQVVVLVDFVQQLQLQVAVDL
jgi:hypothetical protein